jgi:outer membrane protein insertion porin family
MRFPRGIARGEPREGPRGGLALALLLAILAPSALSGQEGAFVISGFEVEGERTLSEDRVVALTGLRGGDPVTLIDLREAVRRLWEADLFRDVAADLRPGGALPFGADPGATPALVVLRIEEAPIASEVTFSGNEELDDEKLAEAFPVKTGDRILPPEVAKGETAIRKLYEDKGYSLAGARAQTGTPGADYRTSLDVQIDEGNKIAIEEIRFKGNRGLDDDELRDAMKTKTDGFFWWQDGEYREDVLRADLNDRLPRVYADHGYLDFTVVADSFAVNPRTGKGVLMIEVREGPQYSVGEVRIEGNTRFPSEYLAKLIEVQPGEIYSEKKVEKTATGLKQLYNNEGYIYAQIAPRRETTSEGGRPVVELVWQIREGEPAEIKRILITGNTVTHERVIRRNLYIFPGDRFREAALIRSLNNLRNLRFFSEIRPDTRIVNEKGDIDLVLEVKEQRTGSLNLGAALGGGTGLSGFIGYEQPNLFGQGKFGRLRFEFGRRNNNFEISYTEPQLFDTRTSASVEFRRLNRRLTGVGFREKLTGGSLSVGTPFPWLDFTRLRTTYGLREIDLESTFSGDERFQGFPRIESSMGVGIVRDTRDLARNSTSGTRHEISAEFTGGILQGTTSYQKYRVETSWFMPTFGRSLVLNLRAKTGVLVESGFVPISEQYILGGVQPPSEGLRGYPDNSVGVNTAGVRTGPSGALNDRGNAFLLLSAEHFFRISDAISTSIFFDAGNVWRDLGSADFGQYKRGAGVGATVEIPGFGPVGLDYAYGFDRRTLDGEPDPKWQLHFKFGQFFQ